MMLGVSAGLSPDPQDPLKYGFRSGSLLRSRGGDRRTTGSAAEPSVDPRSRCPRLEPTGFELRAFIGECLGELLQDLGDQTVGLLDRASGLVDEARLNVQPPRPEGLGWTGRKERSAALIVRLRWPGGLLGGLCGGRRLGLGMSLGALFRRGRRLRPRRVCRCLISAIGAGGI